MNRFSSIIIAGMMAALPVICCSCQSSSDKLQSEKPFALSTISNIFTSNDYCRYGKMQLFAYNDMSVFGKIEASFVYDRKTQNAGLQYRSNVGGYNMMFSQATRKAIAAAYAQYIADFDAQALHKNKTASYKAYGEYPCRIEWGLFAQTASNYADTKVQAGYMFKGKSPYFTLTVWEVDNQKKDVTVSNDEDMQTTYLFMTKDQGQQLCSKLADDAVAAAAVKAEEDDQ